MKNKGSIKELTRQYHLWYPIIFKTNTISTDSSNSSNMSNCSPPRNLGMEDSLPFLLLVRIFSISVDAAENLNKNKIIINNNNYNEIQDRWIVAACAYWIYVITSSIRRKLKLESSSCKFLSPLLLSYINAIRNRSDVILDKSILLSVDNVINKFIDVINQVSSLDANDSKVDLNIHNDLNNDDWLGKNYNELDKFEEWKDSIDSIALPLIDGDIDNNSNKEIEEDVSINNKKTKKQKINKSINSNNSCIHSNNNNDDTTNNPWKLCTNTPIWPIGLIPGHSTSSHLYTVIDY